MEGCRNRNAFIIAILFYFYFIDRPYFSIFIFRRVQVSKQSKAEHAAISHFCHVPPSPAPLLRTWGDKP